MKSSLLNPASILTVAVLCYGCASFKSKFAKSGSYDDLRNNAILDFSTTSIYKKNSVFSMSLQDTFYRLTKVKGQDGIYHLIEGKAYNEIIGVGIRAYNRKFLVDTSGKNEKRGLIPTRYIEKDGKLFFWDFKNNYPVTDSALAVFSKYNLIYYYHDFSTKYRGLETMNNELDKAAHYYFCRDAISRYKRIITSNGMGTYDPPEVKCKP